VSNEILKRWLVLGGLLALTVWLVLNVPESENDLVIINPVSSSKHQLKLDRSTLPVEAKKDSQISLVQRLPITGKSVDLFGLEQEIKPKNKVKPIIRPKPIAKAPALPFTYVGKLVENNTVKVFLLEDQRLHIVKKGEKIGENYQLKNVSDQQISWLYLPLNITQKMSIGKAQ